MIFEVQCATCTRFFADRKGGNYCEAFPDGAGIPSAIIKAEHDHRDPFPGDNGLRYKPVKGADA